MADRPGPVLVTGANSGIGLASTLRFANRGWDTWGTVRSTAKAEVLAEAASTAGVADRVHPLVLDVSDHDAVVDEPSGQRDCAVDLWRKRHDSDLVS